MWLDNLSMAFINTMGKLIVGWTDPNAGYTPTPGPGTNNSGETITPSTPVEGFTKPTTSGTSSTSTVTSLSDLGETLVTLIKKILGPVLAVIGVAGVVYAVVLGVRYAKAEDADARKKVQGKLIGALIGAAIIIVGATLCFALDWELIFEDFSDVSVG